MKRILMAIIFSVVSAVACAAITVSDASGLDSITLTFDAAESPRELWCAWGDADMGDGFADWAHSERVAIIEASATTLTTAIPNDARRAAYARYFLFAGGASYPCEFIRSTGTQGIDTGYCPTPRSAISIDLLLEDYLTVQTRAFSSYGTESMITVYVNGNGGWSWAWIDGTSGNWTPCYISAKDKRTVVTLDGENDRVSISVDGNLVHSTNITAYVAADKRTKSSDRGVSLLVLKNRNDSLTNYAQARLYGATFDEAGVRQHTYIPYVSEGTAGVYDTVDGAFIGNNLGTGEFIPCGRGGDVSGAEASAALDLAEVRGGQLDVETVYINVAKTYTEVFDGPATIDYRIVKVGEGTLVMDGTRTFNQDVIISNGVIRANWATSGLSGTHLGICNTGSNSGYCYFQETGSSFTATPGDSGPGTVELHGYAGIVPYEQDITVNLGGDGRMLTCYTGGFYANHFILSHSSSQRNATFVNGIDFAGNAFESKEIDGGGTGIYTGCITNSAASNHAWNFYSGKTVIVGTRGTANERVDFYGYRIVNHSASLVISNATIRMYNDVINGNSSSELAYTTFVNCDRSATGGYTYSAGKAEGVLTIDGGTYTGTSNLRAGTNSGNREGTIVVTNDAAVTFSGTMGIYTNSTYRQYGGTVKLGKMEMIAGLAELYDGSLTFTGNNAKIGMAPNEKITQFAMYGGSLYINDGQQSKIGSGGDGWFRQMGGTVSVPSYFGVGHTTGAYGRLDVHGGTFTHRNENYVRLGESGTGVVSVANGGVFTDMASGSPMTRSAGSKGTVILSPDGTFETPRLYPDNTTAESSVVFNGGTFRPRTNGQATDFLATTLTRVTVSPYGGAIDTAGRGDFTLNRALGPTTDSGDLFESLAHRWSFNGGSLVDSVGGLTATVSGSIDQEDGAIRLKGTGWNTSSVNLGTTLLPTDGRGATIEVWVTPLAYKSWARVIAFGSESGASKYIYLSFNSGGENKPFHFRINGSGSDEYAKNTAIKPGRTYHVALVLDPLPNGRFLNTVYVHDADTGELLETVQEASNVGWTPAELQWENGCWLGHSNSTSNSDPDARYHEVRIHHRPMTAEQVAASCAAGPDVVYYFRKKGAGTLTMTGANTYAVGTAVDGGTLKLAGGATLPATEMWAGADATLDLNGTSQTAKELGGFGTVKGGTLAVTGTIQPGGRDAVGTLTVDGTALTSGTLVIDVAADGTCDKLVATGALNLSNLNLVIAGAELDKGKRYEIATAASVTGAFASVTLPESRWHVSVSGTKVTLTSVRGTVVIVR